jgi:acetyltransferase-like isoleucine patch superfamily enzyme
MTLAQFELTPREDLGASVLVGEGVVIGEDVQFGAHVVVHAGTRIGQGTVIGDHAVLGKQVRLAAASTASREPLPPLEIAEACTIGSHAVLNAGSKIGPLTLVGDQAMVRERVTIGERCVLGRGALVENDTTLGDRVKVQANAYLTAYMTIEDDVFIAPCVMTTNDNYMGRTDKRFAERGGPTIRRGARVGGGCVLLPNVEIGEEAFVGAGAVVTKDVPARMLVVGSPARVLRGVDPEELLET